MIEQIAANAEVDLHYVSGLPLVLGVDATPFVAACEAARVRILGIEGFRISDAGLRPDMDMILDLSTVSDAATSTQEAASFLATIDVSDLAFDFTLDDD